VFGGEVRAVEATGPGETVGEEVTSPQTRQPEGGVGWRRVKSLQLGWSSTKADRL
jgi:hypothetical protein